MQTLLFPGSFDPPTRGHLNLLERALRLCERCIVAVAVNTSKTPLFRAEERVALWRTILANTPNVEICQFTGLIAQFAKARGATAIVRGIRSAGDYEYEARMAQTNARLYTEIETIFLYTAPEYAHLSSSLIKDVVRFGGDASAMVHPAVEAQMRAKLS